MSCPRERRRPWRGCVCSRGMCACGMCSVLGSEGYTVCLAHNDDEGLPPALAGFLTQTWHPWNVVHVRSPREGDGLSRLCISSLDSRVSWDSEAIRKYPLAQQSIY